jgi:hypothetical protein
MDKKVRLKKIRSLCVRGYTCQASKDDATI